MVVGKKEIQRFIKEPFELKVLDAAFRNLEDKTNDLRFNNFAYVLRELIYLVIDRLAPNKDVIKAKWWKLPKGAKIEDKASRVQQIRYALLDGNSDVFVIKVLGIDVDTIADVINTQLVELNKFTHINPSHWGCPDEELPMRISAACSTITNTLGTIAQIRQKIEDGIMNEINNEFVESLYLGTIDEIDILSTHSSIEQYYIDDIKIERIDENSLLCTTTGSVDVRLQYGSDGDQRRGDGLVSETGFPFSGKFTCQLSETGIDNYKVMDSSIEIDTDSYFE